MANDDIYSLMENAYNSKQQAKELETKETFNKAFEKKAQKPVHTSYPGSAKKDTPYKQPFSEKAIRAVGDPIYDILTQTRPGAALLGIGEGEHQSLQSIANMFRSDENKVGSLGTKELINPEYRGYHAGGKLAGNALIDYGLLRGAGAGMRGVTGLAGLGARMGASAGVGYATGEHFPEQLGGRFGAAALSSLFPVTAGSTKDEIGRNIMQAAENANTRYGGRIGETLAQANPIRPRYTHAMQNLVNGTHNVGEQYGIRELMTDFLTNPSAQTAQNAMAAMKRAQREMLNANYQRVSHLPEASQRAYRALGDGINSLERQIESSLSPEGFRQYQQALRDFAANAAPYAQPAITGAATTGAPKFIPDAIKNMESYSRTLPADLGEEGINQFKFLMQQHPELHINKLLEKIAPNLAKWGIPGSITAYGLDQYLSRNKHEEDNY